MLSARLIFAPLFSAVRPHRLCWPLRLPGCGQLSLVRFDRSLGGDIVEMAHAREEGDVLRPFGGKASHVDEVVRESQIEIVSFVNLRHVLRGELQAQGFDVGFEIGHAVAADHGEHVRGLERGC